MAAWQFVIGIISGFLTAFLAEPIKTYFVNRSKRSKLKTALYREMVSVYDGLKFLVEAIVYKGIDIPIDDVIFSEFSCYEHAKSEPLTFYQLKEAPLINQFYKNISILRNKINNGITSEQSIELTSIIVYQTEKILTSEYFDKRLLARVSCQLFPNQRIKSQAKK